MEQLREALAAALAIALDSCIELDSNSKEFINLPKKILTALGISSIAATPAEL